MISKSEFVQVRAMDASIGRQKILSDLNFSIAKGESLAIMGESGSGKSTLLSVLGGMNPPTQGSYLYGGDEVYGSGARKLTDFRGQEIGFVFQDFCLLPHLSVLENVLVPVEHFTSDAPQFRERAMTLLNQFGLESLCHRRPEEISGGQAQRVAIARALMRNPALILADEPTGNLDDENASIVINVLLDLAKQGRSVVVVTHSETIAARLDRTIFLRQGRLRNDAE